MCPYLIVGQYMHWDFKSYSLSICFCIYMHMAGFYCSKKSCLAAAAAKQHMGNSLDPASIQLWVKVLYTEIIRWALTHRVTEITLITSFTSCQHFL